MVRCEYLIVIASVAALAGMAWGRWTAVREFTCKADTPGRTGTFIGGRMYYVIPESEYVEMSHRSLLWEIENGKVVAADDD